MLAASLFGAPFHWV